MPITHWIAAATLAASLGAQAAPAAAQTAPTPLEMAQAAKLDWTRHLRQAPRCRWDNPTMRSVIAANTDLMDRLAAIAANQASIYIPLPAIEDHPCGSQQDNQTSVTSTGIYWQWLTQLKLLAIYSGQAGWSHELAEVPVSVVQSLDPAQQVIEQAMIAQFGLEAMQQEMATLTQNVQATLALACEGRRDVRSGGTPRACPELTPQFAADRPLGLARLAVAEALGHRLIEALARQSRGEYGNRYQAEYELFGFGSDKCDPGRFSYFPEAPDTVEENGMLNVALHYNGGIVGRARIRILDSGTFQLSSSDGGVIEAGLDEFEALPNFRQCLDS